jgi:hypothetical protein
VSAEGAGKLLERIPQYLREMTSNYHLSVVYEYALKIKSSIYITVLRVIFVKDLLSNVSYLPILKRISFVILFCLRDYSKTG